MASSVTLLADHKGVTAPKVVGDEYVVDALVVLGAYASGGIAVTAAQFGLSSIHAVTLTGQDSVVGLIVVECSATGLYDSNTAIKINCIDEASNQLAEEASTQDFGSIRVRVWGNL